MSSNFLSSAIIGMWRQGNETKVIACELGLDVYAVEVIIKKYKDASTKVTPTHSTTTGDSITCTSV